MLSTRGSTRLPISIVLAKYIMVAAFTRTHYWKLLFFMSASVIKLRCIRSVYIMVHGIRIETPMYNVPSLTMDKSITLPTASAIPCYCGHSFFPAPAQPIWSCHVRPSRPRVGHSHDLMPSAGLMIIQGSPGASRSALTRNLQDSPSLTLPRGECIDPDVTPGPSGINRPLRTSLVCIMCQKTAGGPAADCASIHEMKELHPA
ncbi:MAG: hypothetical protein FRX48_01188 [Lasallia pustulata]|uniref:Uncharacterized protein n=1 Tax=Lasallia pustulata TaxID=136370 RepID=A0A5M8PXG7_9LECA|nr:MAG: hypothetical protein FRX48_01188 [Lasallia pustulata]